MTIATTRYNRALDKIKAGAHDSDTYRQSVKLRYKNRSTDTPPPPPQLGDQSKALYYMQRLFDQAEQQQVDRLLRTYSKNFIPIPETISQEIKTEIIRLRSEYLLENSKRRVMLDKDQIAFLDLPENQGLREEVHKNMARNIMKKNKKAQQEWKEWRAYVLKQISLSDEYPRNYGYLQSRWEELSQDMPGTQEQLTKEVARQKKLRLIGQYLMTHYREKIEQHGGLFEAQNHYYSKIKSKNVIRDLMKLLPVPTSTSTSTSRSRYSFATVGDNRGKIRGKMRVDPSHWTPHFEQGMT